MPEKYHHKLNAIRKAVNMCKIDEIIMFIMHSEYERLHRRDFKHCGM